MLKFTSIFICSLCVSYAQPWNPLIHVSWQERHHFISLLYRSVFDAISKELFVDVNSQPLKWKINCRVRTIRLMFAADYTSKNKKWNKKRINIGIFDFEENRKSELADKVTTGASLVFLCVFSFKKTNKKKLTFDLSSLYFVFRGWWRWVKHIGSDIKRISLWL